MAVNKVDVNGSTVLDLTNDSVTPETLTLGATAHNAAGEQIIGTYEAPEEIFWATYGVTTFSEIKEAYDAGKLLILKVPEDDSIALLKSYYYDEVLASSVVFAISGIRVRRAYVEEFALDPHSNEWRTDFFLIDYSSYSRSVTLSASGWDANTKTQTVSVEGVTATANGSLRIAQSATDDQFTAWGAAQPRVTAQANGSITVKLAGTVPTIDIPVEVLIV